MRDPITVTLAAEPSAPAIARRLLGRWLTEAGAGREEIESLKLACSEACANAVEHAYPPAPAEFDLELRRSGEQLKVIVRDHGRWRPPRGTNRGRGFLLMRAMVDGVDVEQSEAGTTVTLSHHMRSREAVA